MTTTDQLTNKLLEIITQIQQGVVAHGADAVNLTLQAVSYDGICKLLLCVPLLIVIILSILAFKKISKEIKKIKDNSKHMYDDTDGCEMLRFFAAAVAVFGTALLLVMTFNFWNYVQIFNPKLYLAHEIIEKVMK
jgi:hypothetical protein